jgi:hypothetical protein
MRMAGLPGAGHFRECGRLPAIALQQRLSAKEVDANIPFEADAAMCATSWRANKPAQGSLWQPPFARRRNYRI